MISDAPTTKDLLNRRGFAASLSNLIINAPRESSFRLGVYGGWGEGKTSVLKMMQEDLDKVGIRTVPFVAWGTSSEDELLANLIDSIASVLDLKEAKQGKIGTVVTESASKMWDSVADLDWKLKIADKIIGKGLSRMTGAFKGWQSDKLMKAISDALEKKKAVVFVDDLDRAKPELLPNLRNPRSSQPLLRLSAISHDSP